MNTRSFTWMIAAVLMSGVSGLAQPTEFPFTGKVAVKDVNVRAGQSVNFEKLGDLKQGDRVVVVQKSFSWYKIKLSGNAQAYVHRKFVNLLRDGIGEISADNVNVRARPSLNSMVIGQLTKTSKVRIRDAQEEWYQIEPVEGVFGWVLAEFIEFESSGAPEPQVVTMPSRNIYAQKREEEARLKAEEEVRRKEEEKIKQTVRGKILLLETAVNDNIRHEIQTDDGRIFYLMGYRSVLDGFLNHRVQIEGLPKNEIQAAHPVLLVIKVSLVL